MQSAERADPRRIWTVGHSNQDLSRFVDLLQQYGIEWVADVRSEPYSRYATQFNANALKATLPGQGVGYLFLGQQLGGRPLSAEFYLPAKPQDGRRVSPARLERGFVDYERLARSAPFQEGIERLAEGCVRHRLAVMCSEEDPARCHRHWLIAYALVERGIEVQHLRATEAMQSAAALFEAARRQAPQAIQPSLFG